MSERDLESFERWLAPLIEKLSPGERRQLARQIARENRISQRERIKAQRNPDGSAYQPRSALRGQSGSIRRKAMFSKLRSARHLTMSAGPDAAVVRFMGRVARIARVHQLGLRDRVAPGGPTVRYPQRELLGFTRADRERIRDNLIDHLT